MVDLELEDKELENLVLISNLKYLRVTEDEYDFNEYRLYYNKDNDFVEISKDEYNKINKYLITIEKEINYE